MASESDDSFEMSDLEPEKAIKAGVSAKRSEKAEEKVAVKQEKSVAKPTSNAAAVEERLLVVLD